MTYFSPDTKKAIMAHLKGDVKFKETAKILGKSEPALAFLIVAYARYIVRREYERIGSDNG